MEELTAAERDASLVRKVPPQLEVVVQGLCEAPSRVQHLDAQFVGFGCGQAVKCVVYDDKLATRRPSLYVIEPCQFLKIKNPELR